MKLLNRTTLLALVGIALGMVACGGNQACNDLCAKSSACPDTATTEDRCLSGCDSTDDVVDNAGCEPQWDNYLACVGDATNICDEFTVKQVCSAQIGAYWNCIKPFCDQNPYECEAISR